MQNILEQSDMLYKSLSTLAKGTDTHEVVEEYALDGGGQLKTFQKL